MSWLSSLKSVFSPALEVKQEEVQQVLQSYVLPESTDTLQARISQINIEGRVLQLTINTFVHEADHLQKIHDDLADALEKCGIQELNLHVIQQKTGKLQQAAQAEGTESTSAKPKLPPVIDATAASTTATHVQDKAKPAPSETPAQVAEADPNNPPIQKAAPQQRDVPKHPRIKNVILVSSGKGGVGKSTTTVNLALALQQLGLKVGVLDADIYGPSIPTMLGNAGRTPLIEAENFVPIDAYGMPVLSIGHLTGDNNTPVAWRGFKATGALM